MLIERGHANVLDYEYEFFKSMLDATMKIRSIEDKRLAYLLRIGFSSENIDTDIDRLYDVADTNINKEQIQQNIDALMKIQGELK